MYKKVSCRKSNRGFCYESGRLFSENYKICHYGYSIDGGYREVYRIPKSDMNNRNKLEDALIYKCFHQNFDKFDNRACLMALRTRDLGESLVQYDLDTGQQIQEIFLSHVVKFKYIAWAEMNELFYIKSVHSAGRSRFHMATGISMNIAIVIAVFSAFPFKYVGMFEVDRRVFGPGITNAILTNGMLVVMYITGQVKFFSFEYIMEKYKNFEHSLDTPDSSRTIHWGDIPLGLPMNIRITECPPVLFQVYCADQDVQIGGFPWHYIITPRGTFGMFEIASLRDHIRAKGGILQGSIIDPEPDNCIFHGDNSGRIIHVSGSEVKVLQLCNQDEEDTEDRQLKVVCTINVEKHREKESVLVTSSGRCVKRRQSIDVISCEDNSLVHHVEYEDELDLTWISVTSPGIPSRVCFYDNQSFDLLKEVELEATDPSEIYEHNVYVDLDTIVQVTKPRLGQFICNLYRLSGDLSQEKQSEKPETSHRKSREKSSSGNRRQLRARTR